MLPFNTNLHLAGVLAAAATALAGFQPDSVQNITVVGLWQPLQGQRVMDLAVVYGKEVAKLFNSPPWNPEVLDVDVIWPESTYTIQYTPLPTAALSASISWSSTSTGSVTTTMFLKVPTSVSRYDISPRAGTSPSPSTATETTATKTTSASLAAFVSTSGSEAILPSSIMSSAASISTSISASSLTSSSNPSSTSTSVSRPSSTPSSTLNSASGSTSTSSPMTTGLIKDICSLCYVTADTILSCQCGGNVMNGDLNDWVWNDQGVLKAGNGGRFADSCAYPVVNPTISDFKLLAACIDATPTGAKRLLTELDLGPIIQVIYDGEYKLKLKDV